jgi:hypothetical protein
MFGFREDTALVLEFRLGIAPLESQCFGEQEERLSLLRRHLEDISAVGLRSLGASLKQSPLSFRKKGLQAD